jgi:glycerol-3-phosphate O-acyltransferase/dihydroxyacetone phosphate acyltransferase
VISRLAQLAAHLFYRVERLGQPPVDGPLLLVANHPNALLDPALVWTTAGRDVRFLAKSTLFGWNPLSPLVRAARAIPVYRRRDEGVDVSRNAEMFAAVEAALAAGDAICIFPEGTSHSSGRLEQLRTGTARIALGSAAAGVKVAIVAVGLNLDAKMTFRSRATVAYGPPFFCGDLLEAFHRDQAAAVRQLTARMAEHLRTLMIEADPLTDAALVDRIDSLYTAARDLPDAGETRLERRRAIAAGLAALRERSPDRYGRIRQTLRHYDRLLRRFGLRDPDVDLQVSQEAVVRFALREALLAVVLLPIVAVAFVLFVVPYQITALLARVTGQEPDVLATAKVIGGAIVYAVWIAAIAIAVGVRFGPAAAIGAAIAMPVVAVAGLLAIERELTMVDAVRAWVASRRTPPAALRLIAARRAAIADVLDLTYEWISSSASSERAGA